MELKEHASLKRGDLVAGRYEIDGVAGEGGMATVYSARHLHLDEKFAIKVLRPELARDRSVVQRFMDEARSAAQLRSDHACRVFDVGLLPDATPYIVMELLPGEDLREYARRVGLLPQDEAVEFAIQCCEALAEAHALGLVHRDIKPENLFITTRPDGWRSVKLLDFGISKILEGELFSTSVRNIASSSKITGTPQYMAPEEIRSGKDGDARSDLWSLGVVLYEVLAGRCPFPPGTPAEVASAVIDGEVENLGSLRPDLAAGLIETVHWCLAKPRELRASSAAELASQLVPFAPRRARAVVERMQSLARSQGELIQLPPSVFPPPDRVATSVTVVQQPAQRTRWPGAAWGAAILAAFVVAGVVTWLRHQPTAQAPPPVETARPAPVTTSEMAATPVDPPPAAKPEPPASPPAPPQASPPAPPPSPAPPPPARVKGPLPKAEPTAAAPSKPPGNAVTWDSGPDVGF